MLTRTRTGYRTRTPHGDVLQLVREPIPAAARRFIGVRTRTAWALLVNGVEIERCFSFREAVRCLHAWQEEA
jgi:hypothetical protein